jgi:hypothetical protein
MEPWRSPEDQAVLFFKKTVSRDKYFFEISIHSTYVLLAENDFYETILIDPSTDQRVHVDCNTSKRMLYLHSPFSLDPSSLIGRFSPAFSFIGSKENPPTYYRRLSKRVYV